MKGRKTYLQPKEMLLNTIHDTVELVRGRLISDDALNGIIKARFSMYGYKWFICYTVIDIGNNRCSVTIEVEGERKDKKREIRSAFALLNYMLAEDAQIELLEDGEYLSL